MLAHSQNKGVVGIEYGDAVGRKRADQFAFFPYDALLATVSGHVVLTNVGHDADRGPEQSQR